MNKKFLFCAAVACAAPFAAFGQAAGGGAVGAGPIFPNNTDYVDKNGDGCIDHTETKPGSQLEKRFATRDKNKDGKLCDDEYIQPSKVILKP